MGRVGAVGGWNGKIEHFLCQMEEWWKDFRIEIDITIPFLP